MKRSEVLSHNKPDDCWIILDNIVYNVTDYWKVHPGGMNYVLKWAGKDATNGFREYGHTPYAIAQLFSLGAEVGIVEDESTYKSEHY